jgi:hypothetical protein
MNRIRSRRPQIFTGSGVVVKGIKRFNAKAFRQINFRNLFGKMFVLLVGSVKFLVGLFRDNALSNVM